MKHSSLFFLTAAAAMMAVSLTPALAQQKYYPERIITPRSSVPDRWDRQHVHTHLLMLKTTTIANGVQPMGGNGPAGGFSPAQIRSFYHIPSKAGGSNVIAIVDAFDNAYTLQEFNAFSAQFGLPQETSTNALSSANQHFQVIYQGGKQPTDGTGSGWDIEESLDIEWAHAMAPNAKIILIEAQDGSFPNILAAENIATKTVGVKEVSNSWGTSGEDPSFLAYDYHFPKGKGIVYFASTGDSGAYYDYYGFNYESWPASSTHVVAVGGTTVATDSNGRYLYEIGWVNGGGGPSTIFLKPSYQAGIANTDSTYRSTPDIAAVADPITGVSVYNLTSAGGWTVIGGTSVSCPVVAGITNAAGQFRADSIAQLSFMYANLDTPGYYTDIKFGTNGFFCLDDWDMVTGVGVPHGILGM